jgi:hypothetical protein
MWNSNACLRTVDRLNPLRSESLKSLHSFIGEEFRSSLQLSEKSFSSLDMSQPINGHNASYMDKTINYSLEGE